ncbi:sensor histidine kinase [Pseudonocardia humida]|uniref:Sensor histidine kinase n=1 Tax=Pseudonocardia humida TaxID=2800819 RepID=A0ABT1A1D8_9PSEU|nr:sensor histidine kinase [Pseudonocardia humida]MCO1656798.1 sensor histidine kinase [Pseudonocardia humida]
MTVGGSVDRADGLRPHGSLGTLEHDAFLYTDASTYRAGLVPFIREGLALGEPVLVAVPQPGLGLLRAALDDSELARVRTADMSVDGRNPGRIIGSVLTAFVAEHPGTRVRIIGEPIWAGRDAAEYPACAEHEALINVALADAPAFIRCPYDVTKLEKSVLVDATRTHPIMASDDDRWASPGYADPAAVAMLFDSPLPLSPPDADVMVVSSTTGTRSARRFVHEFGTAAGMTAERLGDLRLAVQELVINTLVHSGGQGLLSIWTTGGQVVCQIQDGGRISDPLVGRRPPAPPEVGHGLYIVHQVCDLVRIHRRSTGTTVRVHVDVR